jgi:hypothetical protein
MGNHSSQRLALWVALYLVAYSIASYLDLATTVLAVQVPGVQEGNVMSVDAQGFAATQAWLTTAGGAVIMVGCVVFSFLYSAGISETWLQHPMRSFAKFYVNPWSAEMRDRSPIHMLSFALAFLLIRVLAAANNLLLSEGRFAPLGAFVGTLGRWTSPLVGFVLAILIVFYLLAIVISPLAAAILDRLRRT